MNSFLQDPVIQEHDGIMVVRDDLIPGGTKVRVGLSFGTLQHEFMTRKPNAIPGGGAMPIDRKKNTKAGLARSNGQDLMRGEGKPGVQEQEATGTSIFDPVLCELAYSWFCPPGGRILDPFAGGSVRGIVAALLGHRYFGIDLSERQISANVEQAKAICKDVQPEWICGDSMDIQKIFSGQSDFVFSCPPYGDLEVYSEDGRDLSTKAHEEFILCYRSIIASAVFTLRPNRFACFVVGDFRDKAGFYRNFVAETISAFEAAGAKLYNEAILVTAVGSLPIRIGKQFGKNRKLGKTHQNVLVFYKGDPKKIASEFAPVEISFPESETYPSL